MNDIPALALGLLAGAMLGAVFFGGLWWTVRKGVRSENPALWFLGSLLLRTGLVLGGFYVGLQGHWSRFAMCVVGFIIARVVIVRWLAGKPDDHLTPMKKEAHIAP
jgi:F1F0 ATPase subunit 2